MDEAGITGLDVIFSALTLHHLSNPSEALHRLSKLLNKGGVIILRGSDDETKIAFPDNENLLPEIIRETSLLPTVSDRFNGRKLYHHLFELGLNNIHMFNKVVDTSGMDIKDRVNLFIQSFSYRKNYLYRLVEQSPNEPEWSYKLARMEEMLEKLELKFRSKDFYYMELVSVAVGQKHQ